MIEMVLGHLESDLVVGFPLEVGGPGYDMITLFSLEVSVTFPIFQTYLPMPGFSL